MNAYFLSSTKNDEPLKKALDSVLGCISEVITDLRTLRSCRTTDETIFVIASSYTQTKKAFEIMIEKRGTFSIVLMTEIFPKQPLECHNGKSLYICHDTYEAAAEAIKEAKGMKKRSSFVWGKSGKMESVRTIAERAAKTPLSIHISGEIGTGKSQLAEEIANISGIEGKFVSIDCSTLVDNTLADDMLFGHTKGSFTSCEGERKGLIGEADGGTLFLDEIQNLSKPIEAKLLRAIEKQLYYTNGSDTEKKSQFRLITASSLSHKELENTLSPALLSRIGEIKLTLPPIRERKEDIPLLVKHFEKKLKSRKASFRIENPELWKKYDFMDNVRGLRRSVEVYMHMGTLPEAKEQL